MDYLLLNNNETMYLAPMIAIGAYVILSDPTRYDKIPNVKLRPPTLLRSFSWYPI